MTKLSNFFRSAALSFTAALLLACGNSVGPEITTPGVGTPPITGPVLAPACTGQASWPTAALTAADAVTVDPAQFIPESQLRDWGFELDSVGLRATGDAPHEAYIDRLVARLKCMGVTDVRLEDVPIANQWLVGDYALSVASGLSAGPVPVAAYVPYSGSTPDAGVTAPLVFLDTDTVATAENAAGKIVLYEVPETSLPIAAFGLFTMGQFNITSQLAKIYTRPYLAQEPVSERQDQLQAAGAVGGIAILAGTFDTVRGSYFPYDGVLHSKPQLYVDRDVGAQLMTLAASATPVTLKLTAKVQPTVTRNILAYIPGASDELTVLHSHTDGTNSIEDNGPDAVLGIAQNLVRLPRSALPRTVLIFLTAGHFTGGGSVKEFLHTHANDGLIPRIASITTIEHMGAQEWEPDANGTLVYTGNPELGAIFLPQIQAFADAACDAFINADAGPGAVLKPLNPDGDGSARDAVWPGEGQYFYGLARITTANYITGPYYLLNWGVATAPKTDFDRMRAEMIAFAQMQLDISRLSKAALSTEGVGIATIGSGKYLSKGLCVPTPLPVSVPLP